MSDYDFYLQQQQRRREVFGGRATRASIARVTQAKPYINEDAPDRCDDDERWPLCQSTSTRRYAQQALPPARTSAATTAGVPALRRERSLPAVVPMRAQQPGRAADRQVQRRQPLHWLVYFGIGMLALLVLWLLFTVLGSWWQDTQNDWTYGHPRTFQIDAVVGHHDSAQNPSHFIAMNLNAQLIIIEFPGGDPTHARVYNGPRLIGPGEDLAPVTLSFRDVTGDGKPDMIATIDGTEIVFINDQGSFRPPRPGEVKPSAVSGQQ